MKFPQQSNSWADFTDFPRQVEGLVAGVEDVGLVLDTDAKMQLLRVALETEVGD